MFPGPIPPVLPGPIVQPGSGVCAKALLTKRAAAAVTAADAAPNLPSLYFNLPPQDDASYPHSLCPKGYHPNRKILLYWPTLISRLCTTGPCQSSYQTWPV